MLTKNEICEKLSKILPSENILTSEQECYVYAQDATNKPELSKLPDAVIFVENISQIQEVMKLSYEHEIPVICRGAGTNLVGACNTECGGIVMNFSKMNRILEISKENMMATVEAGVVVGDLQQAVEKIGLFYPPDPSNLKVSTIGASIALSSGGPKTFKYGSTKDYVLDLKVVLANGEVINTGSKTVKNATGYNLNQIFVGSEGTLGIVAEATLKLIAKPEATKVILAYFDSVSDAVNAVNEIISAQIMPSTIDFMDKNSIQTIEKFYPAGLLTEKEAALIIEVDGCEMTVASQQEKVAQLLKDCGASAVQTTNTDEDAKRIWMARRSSYGAAAKLRPNVLTEDVIVPRNNLAKLVEGINKICSEKAITVCVVGHVGDGNVHPQMALDLRNKDEYENYLNAKKEIYELTLSLGGILSGEHGIGSEKKKFLADAVGDKNVELMRKIKMVFDEKNILNPKKIFD